MMNKCDNCDEPGNQVGTVCRECGRGMIVNQRKPYAIRGIPTSPNGERAALILKDYKNYTYKKHGRGHRFGRYNTYYGIKGQGDWCQELPLEFAARFTLYAYPKQGRVWEKDYWQYKGMRDGKPVIRQYHP